MRVWDSATGREARDLKGHTLSPWGVAFSHDGTRLASASEQGEGSRPRPCGA